MAEASYRALVVWAILAVLSVVYVIFAAKSFNILGDLDDNLKRLKDDDDLKGQFHANYRGGCAACFLSIVAVLVYVVLTFVFTIRKRMNEGSFDGVMLSILLTCSLYSSAFMLLVGVVLQANDYMVEHSKDDEHLTIYRFAYGIAYTLTAIYASLVVYYAWDSKSSTNKLSVDDDQFLLRTTTHSTEPLQTSA